MAKKITVKQALDSLNEKYAKTLVMLDDALDVIEDLETQLEAKPKEVQVEVEKVVEVVKEVEVPKETVVTREVEVPGPERIVEVPGPERIVEKIVEVPVEKIVEKIKKVKVPVEKEVIKEVAVEKIVEKEVPVEKVVHVPVVERERDSREIKEPLYRRRKIYATKKRMHLNRLGGLGESASYCFKRLFIFSAGCEPRMVGIYFFKFFHEIINDLDILSLQLCRHNGINESFRANLTRFESLFNTAVSLAIVTQYDVARSHIIQN